MGGGQLLYNNISVTLIIDFCIDIIKEDNLTRFSQFKQIWLKWIVSRDFRSMSFDRSYISTIEGVVL
jgi:hypothetical protein